MMNDISLARYEVQPLRVCMIWYPIREAYIIRAADLIREAYITRSAGTDIIEKSRCIRNGIFLGARGGSRTPTPGMSTGT